MVDVYSDWSGPCSAMTNFLKKIKLEVNDDLLHYAMAKSGANFQNAICTFKLDFLFVKKKKNFFQIPFPNWSYFEANVSLRGFLWPEANQ